MTFADGFWTLDRRASPPDFSQRYRAAVIDDGDTIEGRWEISMDGSTWGRDFELTYTRVP